MSQVSALYGLDEMGSWLRNYVANDGEAHPSHTLEELSLDVVYLDGNEEQKFGCGLGAGADSCHEWLASVAQSIGFAWSYKGVISFEGEIVAAVSSLDRE